MSKLPNGLDARLHCESDAKQFIVGLNANELKHLNGEICARLFWRNSFKHSTHMSNAYVAKLIKINRYIKKRLYKGTAAPEMTRFGSIIERSSYPYEDTLSFFCRVLNPSWEIVFQESSYYAIWRNKEKRSLCIFCEGDVTFFRSPDTTSFQSEYIDHCEWHGANISEAA